MCGTQHKSVLGILAFAAGILAVLAVIGFWIVESGRSFLGFEAEHLFRDSIMLFLASFWLRWAGKAVACHKMGSCGMPSGEKGGNGKCCT